MQKHSLEKIGVDKPENICYYNTRNKFNNYVII